VTETFRFKGNRNVSLVKAPKAAYLVGVRKKTRRGVRIVEVAERARVALSTASDILNGKLKGTAETAARVRRAASDLGYKPNLLARGLRQSRAGAIGLVAPFPRPLFTSALLADLVSGIQLVQRETGVNLLLAAGHYPDGAYGEDLVSARAVDGLIVIGTREAFGRNMDKDVLFLRKLGCPLVWLNYFHGRERVDWVTTRTKDALPAVLSHLEERGHERVGFLEWSAGAEKRKTLPAAMLERYGMTTRPEWVAAGETWGGTAFASALRVLSAGPRSRPTAVVCSGDDLALVALQAALALGLRVPSDVAIASLATYSVGDLGAMPITTFGPPTIDLGRRAALRLLERIATPDLPEGPIEVEGTLVVRASTVPA
jgi:LacI family transcriptional regulator, fructose operon transcriptional repressor